jgi:signal transduction histidine kinase
MLAAAVVPLGLVGLWTTRSAARSGRTLLASQLEAALAQTAADVEARWAAGRSDLLLLTENEPVRQLLADTTGRADTPEFVTRVWEQMTSFSRVVVRDRRGRERVRLDAMGLSARTSPDASADLRGISIRMPVMDLLSGDTLGSVDAVVRAVVLLPSLVTPPARNAPVVGLVLLDGSPIGPPSTDGRIFRDETVRWAGYRWLAAHRRLSAPPVDLAIAGPLDPYVQPFERSARSAAIALLVTTIAVVVIITILSRRAARDVERELAQREALAAVGEFASELSHEVRNPLTAVRLDLQRIGEVTDDPESVQRIASRVLRQIERIDRAVTGALRVARGGGIERRRVDLTAVLETARRAAEPEFAHRGARLVVNESAADGLELDGDAAALEQLFLNLLINAAQAMPSGGTARVDTSRRNGAIEVTIADTGAGMSPQQIEATRQPFRSSKRDGTGLGLKIARRIVANHHGELDLHSAIGEGTTVRVALPTRH